jgi:transposase
MKFEEVYGRTCRGGLSQAEAAEILGMSERTFRRWRDRYEATGAEGLFDRRLRTISVRRAPVDEVAQLLMLFDTRYFDFTPKHFHEKLVAEHDCMRSYNWVRLTLQAHGRVTPAPRRGAHRRKRPRRPMQGMMLHQDGSRHAWVPGEHWDVIVTLDDATSEIYSAFFVAEEGTMSTFRALTEVIAKHGLFCALYADRGSHYWYTPEAGGKVDKDKPTQVGRALAQLGIELIPAYSPEARGRSERMFATLQDRLPKELRLAGITSMDAANRFLADDYLPRHNTRFARPPEEAGSAFVPFAGTRGYPLRPGGTAGRQRQHGALQEPRPADPRRPPSSPLRQGDGAGSRVPGRHARRLPRSAAPGAIFGRRHSPRRTQPKGGVMRFDVAAPVDLMDNAAALPTTPQAPQQQQKRSLHLLPAPVSSNCW